MRQHVYILIDPATDEVRYVGLTTTPRQRQKQHQLGIAVPRNQGLTEWEHHLRDERKKPIFKIIVSVRTFEGLFSNSAGRVMEDFWIDHYHNTGAPLFNRTGAARKPIATRKVMDPNSIGNQIKKNRGDVPRSTVAKLSDVSYGLLGLIETDKHSPTTQVVARICAATGGSVTIDGTQAN